MSTRRKRNHADISESPAGAGYVAVVRLSTKAGETLAAAGKSCEHVPETSLAWLAEQGLIVPASPAKG